jgi:hypothetical protein
LNLDADLNGGEHRCNSSSDFVGFTWCYVHSDEIANSVPFKSYISILINSNNKVVFVTQSVVPAFFRAGDVDREVKRISRGFGLEARFENAEPRPGVPQGCSTHCTESVPNATRFNVLRRNGSWRIPRAEKV